VRLTLHNPPQTSSPGALTYTATTNSDGRVTAWTADSKFSDDALDVVWKREWPEDQRYSLSFDTEGYFGAVSYSCPLSYGLRLVCRGVEYMDGVDGRSETLRSGKDRHQSQGRH
jgi:hypothetical protein